MKLKHIWTQHVFLKSNKLSCRDVGWRYNRSYEKLTSRNKESKKHEDWKLHPKSEDSQQLYFADRDMSSKTNGTWIDKASGVENNTNKMDSRFK